MSAITMRVKVKPGAKRSSLEQEQDGSWVARVKSPPVDGRANEELVTLIARQFGCRRSAVRIRAGASGRMKLVSVDTG